MTFAPQVRGPLRHRETHPFRLLPQSHRLQPGLELRHGRRARLPCLHPTLFACAAHLRVSLLARLRLRLWLRLRVVVRDPTLAQTLTTGCLAAGTTATASLTVARACCASCGSCLARSPPRSSPSCRRPKERRASTCCSPPYTTPPPWSATARSSSWSLRR